MRGIEAAQAYASPAPDLVRKVQQRFSSRSPMVDLGELWLRWIGGVLQLTREPGEEGIMASQLEQLSCAEDLLASAGASMPVTAHPSSARERRKRFEKVQEPKPKPEKPIHFEAGNLRVELLVTTQGNKPTLRVRLEWTDTRAPARGIPLYIDSKLGKDEQAETDNQGRAELTFPGGPSQLHILAGTPVRLRLNAAD